MDTAKFALALALALLLDAHDGFQASASRNGLVSAVAVFLTAIRLSLDGANEADMVAKAAFVTENEVILKKTPPC